MAINKRINNVQQYLQLFIYKTIIPELTIPLITNKRLLYISNLQQLKKSTL